MRISDWSSDVCSSDLTLTRFTGDKLLQAGNLARTQRLDSRAPIGPRRVDRDRRPFAERLRVARVERLRRFAGRIFELVERAARCVQPRLGLAAQRDETVQRRRLLWGRSEEHTSELQSLMRISYAVFCLKTKNKQNEVTIL